MESLSFLIEAKKFEKEEEKQTFLISLKPILLELVNQEIVTKCKEQISSLFKNYFKFFASNDNLLVEGLKFFSLFEGCIKSLKFNSLKAFLFYFAFQTNRYSSPIVKELLNQQLLIAEITDTNVYLDFCMYCFYKGLYLLSKKNYVMTTYNFVIPVSLGFNTKDGNFILNNFNIQMLKYLCFLKFLTNFDISPYFMKEKIGRMEIQMSMSGEVRTGNRMLDIYLNYIKNQNKNYDIFVVFCKEVEEDIKNSKLSGIKKEAEEEIIFKSLKDHLSIYKRIKLSKLATLAKIDFPICLNILQKKVMEGKINIKYDEIEDIIEVFEIDQGTQESFENMKELYKELINANKNMFVCIKDRKNAKPDQKNFADGFEMDYGNDDENMMLDD